MGAIFLSYSRDSAAVADALAADLGQLGHSVWFDRELTGGQAWWTQILARVRACDLFVIVVTTQAFRSVACKREYEYAVALGKPVLPVLASDSVSPNLLPPALAQIQFVDYRFRDRAAVLRLARAVTALPAAGPLPDPLPPAPDVPVSYLGSLAERVSKPTLSYDEQSTLLFELKRGFLDSEAEADARELLKELRKRRDLYAAIAEEIDGLQASAATASRRATRAVRQGSAHIDMRGPTERRLAAYKGWSALSASRSAVLWGFVVGSAIGVAAVISNEPNLWFVGFALGIAGAIAGAICQLRPMALAGAGIGAALGWSSVTLIYSGADPIFWGVIFGAGPGAILGAVLASSYLNSRTVKQGDSR